LQFLKFYDPKITVFSRGILLESSVINAGFGILNSENPENPKEF